MSQVLSFNSYMLLQNTNKNIINTAQYLPQPLRGLRYHPKSITPYSQGNTYLPSCHKPVSVIWNTNWERLRAHYFFKRQQIRMPICPSCYSVMKLYTLMEVNIIRSNRYTFSHSNCSLICLCLVWNIALLLAPIFQFLYELC